MSMASWGAELLSSSAWTDNTGIVAEQERNGDFFTISRAAEIT